MPVGHDYLTVAPLMLNLVHRLLRVFPSMTDSRVERTGYSTIPKQCRFYMVGNLFTTVVLLFFDRGKHSHEARLAERASSSPHARSDVEGVLECAMRHVVVVLTPASSCEKRDVVEPCELGARFGTVFAVDLMHSLRAVLRSRPYWVLSIESTAQRR